MLRGIDVLPDEEKALKIGRAEGLDFRAQAIERVSVNAREQTTVAPFELARAAEAAAQHDALGFERDEGCRRVGLGNRQPRREGRGSRGTNQREPAANQLPDRKLACPPPRPPA